ncbi:MAG: hypothetical protein KJP23_00835 [Deltaproteobacteria bacterium]|nr:hypothetical protein [Deltaproteobacteria bacterium]
MNTPAVDLNTDVYNFLGYRIGISSNSEKVLSHFRSVYERFYSGKQVPGKNANGHPIDPVVCTIEAIDNIESHKILSINDGKEFYSLRCKSLYEFDQEYYGKGTIVDPIAFISYLFLKNKYKMIQDLQLFHAAAVSRNGRGLILPASEGMGKTTLSVQLVKNGFEFLSDEVACIDLERQIIEPYARKLNINASSCALLNLPQWPDQFLRRSGTDEIEWIIDIEQIMPGSLSAACPLSHIIFLRGFGETPRLEPISASNALFRLFKYSLSPTASPAALLFKFAWLLDRIKCYNLVCADPDKTARIIEKLVDGKRRDNKNDT